MALEHWKIPTWGFAREISTRIGFQYGLVSGSLVGVRLSSGCWSLFHLIRFYERVLIFLGISWQDQGRF